MALEKEFTLPSGVVGEYLRIGQVILSNYRVRLRVDLYKDAAARQAHKSPLVEGFAQKQVSSLHSGDMEYAFSITEEQLDDNLLELAYDFLKTLPTFSDAEDV